MKGGCLAFLVGLAVFALLGGWCLMLAVAVIHEKWIHECPTIGYWWAVLLVVLLRAALTAGSAT